MDRAHGQHCPDCHGFRAGIVRRYRNHLGQFTRFAFVCGACETESKLRAGLGCRRCGDGRLEVTRTKRTLCAIVRLKRCRSCGFHDQTVEYYRTPGI